MSRKAFARPAAGSHPSSPRALAARVLATTLRHWGSTPRAAEVPEPVPAPDAPKRSLLAQGAVIAANSRLGRRFVLTRKQPDLEPNPQMVSFQSGWHATNIGAPRRFAI